MFPARLLDCLSGKKKQLLFKTDLFNLDLPCADLFNLDLPCADLFYLDLPCADPSRKVALVTDFSFFGHA
jgi:hypothetical protein